MSNVVLPLLDLALILYNHATAAVEALDEVGSTVAGEIVSVANAHAG